LVKRLADLYPDSNHVYHLGIDLVPDMEMREYAGREGFVIVAKDSDFSDLCILLGFPPKVIWIRRGNCSSKDIESILRDHASDIDALEREEVVGILTLF
jgi:predicted nuclease of predicted toxin-antitoxin system